MPLRGDAPLPRDIVLRDGSTVTLRAATDADAPSVLALFETMPPDGRSSRFLALPRLDGPEVRALLATNPSDAYTILAESGGRVGGVAGFRVDQQAPAQAEVAFAVAHEFEGRGVATRLLEKLADVARQWDIDVFSACVTAENRGMLGVFSDSGYEVSRDLSAGVYQVRLSLKMSVAQAEKTAYRSRVAATASMRSFFAPRAVTVVGASRHRGKIGAEILHNLIAAGYTGTLSAVHPSATEIDGVPAYPSVASIPGEVDLAVISVPAVDVLETVDHCVAKGVRGICVISAGFSESDADGRAREAALMEKVRQAGCRLIGPNCMGLLNTSPDVRLNATFSPVYPPEGSVAMSTQSGALGLAILDYARQLNIGISSFVSIGNKADVSGNDLIQYWADDPRTSVILLYLESFGNPRKFTEIARRVSRTKPIAAVKSGRSTVGARAASSHTGALAATDTVVDALFRQAGVIRTETLQELFDVAALLSHQPLPAGRRVAILTNAGGPGILAADACDAHGLELPPLSESTRSELRSFLPAAASVGNPVDMLASAPAEHYRRALAALVADEAIDAVLVIFIPPLVTDPEGVAAAIVDVARDASGKTVLAVFMRAAGSPAALHPIPCYAFPESAAIALARVTSYAAWRRKPAGTIPHLEHVDEASARASVSRALERGGGWLTADELHDLMDAVGIAAAPAKTVRTSGEAGEAAAALGFPVVLKGLGPNLLHKTERRAVALNLASGSEVRAAADDLSSRLGDDLTGFMVQRMVPDGVEMLVGATTDPLFGPVVVCGTGGVLVDLVADSALRLHPLTTADAAEMIEELRGTRLLRGYRGAAPSDVAALQDVILRISALLTVCPEIQELDINPLKVLQSGACAVDVRVRAERPGARSVTRRVEY